MRPRADIRASVAYFRLTSLPSFPVARAVAGTVSLYWLPLAAPASAPPRQPPLPPPATAAAAATSSNNTRLCGASADRKIIEPVLRPDQSSLIDLASPYMASVSTETGRKLCAVRGR